MPRAPRQSLRKRARSKADVSAGARRQDGIQARLPFRPVTRAGAQKVRTRGSRPRVARRLALLLLGLITALLVANAILGTRGFAQTLITRRERQQLAESISDLQRENRQLATLAERLRHDPAAIEALARGELGFILPGERLFIVVDRTRP